MNQILELFGPRLTAMHALVAGCYLLWSTLPLWWPTLKEIRSGAMTRRLAFVTTTAALAYGTTAIAVIFAVALFNLSRALAATDYGHWLTVIAPAISLAVHIGPHAFLCLVILHLAVTVCITQQLAKHWPSLSTYSAVVDGVPRG